MNNLIPARVKWGPPKDQKPKRPHLPLFVTGESYNLEHVYDINLSPRQKEPKFMTCVRKNCYKATIQKLLVKTTLPKRVLL